MDYVNSSTTKQAPEESMIQLGTFLKRLIETLADNYNTNQTLRFAKMDTRYGLWCLKENEHDEWNFVYVLPSFRPIFKIYDINTVVPNCMHTECCK